MFSNMQLGKLAKGDFFEGPSVVDQFKLNPFSPT
jgi:hypothetical protein